VLPPLLSWFFAVCRLKEGEKKTTYHEFAKEAGPRLMHSRSVAALSIKTTRRHQAAAARKAAQGSTVIDSFVLSELLLT
jgi:hypothetical protein